MAKSAKKPLKKKAPVGRHRIPRRWAAGVAKRQAKAAKARGVARAHRAAREAVSKRQARTVVKIRYSRTKTGRVRFQPLDAQQGKGISASYASRQGARRAARRQFKGARVVAVVEV